MHSYEERMQAVAFYIKLGKRLRATIHELRYPTKNALKGWYREYERHQNLRKGSARRPPKFSEELKASWHEQEHRPADLSTKGLAGKEEAGRYAASDAGWAIGCHRAE